MKSKIVIVIAFLASYLIYKLLSFVYVKEVVNSTPRPTTMYRIVTSDVDDWSPPRRIFLQGYFGSFVEGVGSIWVSKLDADLENLGAGIDIHDSRIHGEGCMGNYVVFVGKIGVPKGHNGPILFETEQIYISNPSSQNKHMSKEELEISREQGCFLDSSI